jgi:hypothetical protein
MIRLTQLKALLFTAVGYGGILSTWKFQSAHSPWYWAAFAFGVIGALGVLSLKCENCGLNVFCRKGRESLLLFTPFFFIVPKCCPRCGHRHR